MNIAQNLERAAYHFAEHPAILFEGRVITYAELEIAVDCIARGLTAHGISTGDRVALFLPNIPEFIVAYLAVQKVGAITVSVNVMLLTEELRYVLEDSGARLLVTIAALLPQVEPLLSTTVTVREVILAEGESSSFRNFQDFGVEGNGRLRAVDLDRDTPAAILYTSGTTGRQKGATLSHGNVVSNMYATGDLLRIDPTDRLLLFLPLFHCFGQNFIMNTALNRGAAIVLHRRFVPEQILSSIARDGVTMFFAVPTVYIGLLQAGTSSESMASVRYYFSAAATMPVEVASRWREVFGRPICEGYGLTETSPFSSYNHEWEHRPGSVGTPIEMVEVRVLDENDQPVSEGVWGEIAIKGPNVMLGYWNRAEETAEALRGGWFHTGDIGYADEHGYVFLVDRVKDMINVGGFKVWPREVEQVLYQHPAIAECAVVGAPDAIKGEITRAVIVLCPGTSVAPDEIEDYCRRHLAAYKVPATIEVVDELPKSPTGKILKRVLRMQRAEVAPLQ